MKALSELLSFLGFIEYDQKDITIRHLQIDSREVNAGDAFIAIKGAKLDGREFIQEAIKNGAVAVFYHSDKKHQISDIKGVPIIHVADLDKKQIELATYFYDNPSSKLQVVGVTGTNGKTTITNLIAQWINLLQKSSSVIGTMGNGSLNQLVHAKNTTASACDIQKMLAEFVEQDITLTAMEVSSHGLVQDRVKGVQFDAVAFTNLTRDHLDFHGDMKAYEAAKWRLFSEFPSTQKIINADDPVGRKWLTKLPQAIAVSNNNIDLSHHQKWIKALNITYHSHNVIITFESSWGNGIIESRLMGGFNVNNLLIALATLLSLGYALDELLNVSSKLVAVKGRMEMIKRAPTVATVVIDYAHTPDALKQALFSLKSHCDGDLWCIFGCGGDRDKGKRPLMAAMTEQYADHVIVTDDNPRTESSESIIADILTGFNNPSAIKTISNRQDAIYYALDNARANDIILVAGKGHETEQIIGHDVFYHSDYDVVNHYKVK